MFDVLIVAGKVVTAFSACVSLILRRPAEALVWAVLFVGFQLWRGDD